jgi:hypothetical protein
VRSTPEEWFERPVAQIMFERHARRAGMTFERKVLRSPAGLTYRFAIDVPVHDERRLVTAIFDTYRVDPRVWVDGPICRRHRGDDNSLCMWFERDRPDHRWIPDDGLLSLAVHVEEHTYCEAECRAGNPWPKKESPGRHPRPAKCPCC